MKEISFWVYFQFKIVLFTRTFCDGIETKYKRGKDDTTIITTQLQEQMRQHSKERKHASNLPVERYKLLE
jgi:hypothetical protein